MKFNLILLASISTILAANIERRDDAKSTETSSSVKPQQTAEDSEAAKCVKEKKCNGDLGCLASCNNVPNPSGTQAQNTNDCVAKCDKSNAEEYSKCSQKCIADIYLNHPDSSKKPDSSSSSGSANSSSTTGADGKQTAVKGSSASSQAPAFFLSSGLLLSLAYYNH
ncbi:hypothetical protein K502DRAFT_348892 [Neoconidiobolus thromboides FSU 785]|nr:hypothetical protein K502DRAFT_348892 [Neoconidiobolus thromboides FSU 785]